MMKLFTAVVMILAGGCVWGQKPKAMDCTNNPPCLEYTCTCLPGTYHPQPSFMIDERYGEYEFSIHLEKGWDCKPVIAKDGQSLTVTCKKALEHKEK